MDNQPQQKKETSSRKKFVVWGLGILGSLSLLKYINRKPSEQEQNKRTVKMLAQDGTLVEVDASKVYCGNRKKINDDELKNWVTKK